MTSYQITNLVSEKNKITINCIFVLHNILNSVIYKVKKKLYCAFIDFKKAFDLVYRNGIWFKLFNIGNTNFSDTVNNAGNLNDVGRSDQFCVRASTKFVRILQSMYESVKTCVKSNNNVSDYFDIMLGVKQVETLSHL